MGARWRPAGPPSFQNHYCIVIFGRGGALPTMFSSGTLPSLRAAAARPAGRDARVQRRALRVLAAKGSKNAKGGGGGGSAPRMKSPGDVKEGSAYSQARARGRRARSPAVSPPGRTQETRQTILTMQKLNKTTATGKQAR